MRKILLIQQVLVITLIIGSTCILSAPTCTDKQKLRTDGKGNPICCSTVICNTSQTFGLCNVDQGSDKCVDCDPGFYTKDRINTKDWEAESDGICVPTPTCDSDEVHLVGTGCQCNLDNGYYGGDPNNCKLAVSECNDPGQQLGNNGHCIPCDSNHFKPYPQKYGGCREKTKCKEGEEESNSGTTTTDRTCRPIQTMAPVPETTTTTESPEQEDESGNDYLKWLIPLIVAVIAAVVGLCCFYRMRANRTAREDAEDVEVIVPMLPNGKGVNNRINHRNGILGKSIHLNRGTSNNGHAPQSDSINRNASNNGTAHADPESTQTLQELGSLPDSLDPSSITNPSNSLSSQNTESLDLESTIVKQKQNIKSTPVSTPKKSGAEGENDSGSVHAVGTNQAKSATTAAGISIKKNSDSASGSQYSTRTGRQNGVPRKDELNCATSNQQNEDKNKGDFGQNTTELKKQGKPQAPIKQDSAESDYKTALYGNLPHSDLLDSLITCPTDQYTDVHHSMNSHSGDNLTYTPSEEIPTGTPSAENQTSNPIEEKPTSSSTTNETNTPSEDNPVVETAEEKKDTSLRDSGKERPLGIVTPIRRAESSENAPPNNQDPTVLYTREGNREVQQAVNNEDQKLVANTPRPVDEFLEEAAATVGPSQSQSSRGGASQTENGQLLTSPESAESSSIEPSSHPEEETEFITAHSTSDENMDSGNSTTSRNREYEPESH